MAQILRELVAGVPADQLGARGAVILRQIDRSATPSLARMTNSNVVSYRCVWFQTLAHPFDRSPGS
jgi:hypothetical protein